MQEGKKEAERMRERERERERGVRALVSGCVDPAVLLLLVLLGCKTSIQGPPPLSLDLIYTGSPAPSPPRPCAFRLCAPDGRAEWPAANSAASME